MIKLYQFPPCWGLPNGSPFCMKLETYLRMANIPYEVVTVINPQKSPKGKLPVIKDNGKLIADSGLIIDYLKETYGDKLDATLTPLQKAQSLAWQRLMEEHLYWVALYSRWMDEANWPLIKNMFFGKMPYLMKAIISRMVKNNMRKELHGHGMGRHTQDEIYRMGVEDLKALQQQLGEQSYFMGDTPTSIDACLYAYLANFLVPPIVSPMSDYVKSQANFVKYCERMQKKYYS